MSRSVGIDFMASMLASVFKELKNRNNNTYSLSCSTFSTYPFKNETILNWFKAEFKPSLFLLVDSMFEGEMLNETPVKLQPADTGASLSRQIFCKISQVQQIFLHDISYIKCITPRAVSFTLLHKALVKIYLFFFFLFFFLNKRIKPLQPQRFFFLIQNTLKSFFFFQDQAG